jgi:hypothetical protein
MEENANLGVDSVVPEAEKMLSQQQVNDILKREKALAADKARREIEAEYAQKMQGMQSSHSMPPSMDMDRMYNDISSKLMSDLQRKQQEEMQAKMEEERISRSKAMADEYFNKMQRGRELFQDFEEVLADFKPQKFPEVALLAGQMENTPEIMYELAKNPSKLNDINGLAKSDPEWAMKQLKKLSDSISANKQAMSNRSPNAPLSTVRSSSVGGVDAVPNSVDDLRRLAAFRG